MSSLNLPPELRAALNALLDEPATTPETDTQPQGKDDRRAVANLVATGLKIYFSPGEASS